jgi:hypothetical protein
MKIAPTAIADRAANTVPSGDREPPMRLALIIPPVSTVATPRWARRHAHDRAGEEWRPPVPHRASPRTRIRHHGDRRRLTSGWYAEVNVEDE